MGSNRKKKKIRYDGIPKEVLNTVLGEYWDEGEYTLKTELDKYGEDIIRARWVVSSENKLEWFHAWTKTYTMSLVHDLMDERIILGLLRNPPDDERSDG